MGFTIPTPIQEQAIPTSANARACYPDIPRTVTYRGIQGHQAVYRGRTHAQIHGQKSKPHVIVGMPGKPVDNIMRIKTITPRNIRVAYWIRLINYCKWDIRTIHDQFLERCLRAVRSCYSQPPCPAH